MPDYSVGMKDLDWEQRRLVFAVCMTRHAGCESECTMVELASHKGERSWNEPYLYFL